MHSITIADIKRGGMVALDAALQRGSTAIMKRNRVAAVVLTPAAYESLLARAQTPAATGSALDWLLQASAPAQPPGLSADAMTERLAETQAPWAAR